MLISIPTSFLYIYNTTIVISNLDNTRELIKIKNFIANIVLHAGGIVHPNLEHRDKSEKRLSDFVIYLTASSTCQNLSYWTSCFQVVLQTSSVYEAGFHGSISFIITEIIN